MDRIRYTIIILMLIFCTSVCAQEVTVSRKTAHGNGVDVTKWAAYKKAGSTYDLQTKELGFDVNEHTGKGWLLIHNGVKVINIICEDGTTGTIWNMVPCKDKADCFVQADLLGLTYNKTDYDHEDDCTKTVGPVVIRKSAVSK